MAQRNIVSFPYLVGEVVPAREGLRLDKVPHLLGGLKFRSERLFQLEKD